MTILTTILNALVVLICLFLICLILIQRGKGGGLAGAFGGGAGSSSAFGTKAGDVFTRVTMYVAIVWIVLSMLLVILYNRANHSAWGTDAPAAVSKEKVPANPTRAKAGTSSAAPATTTPAAVPTPGAATDIPAIPDSPAVTPAPAATAPAAAPATAAPTPAPAPATTPAAPK